MPIRAAMRQSLGPPPQCARRIIILISLFLIRLIGRGPEILPQSRDFFDILEHEDEGFPFIIIFRVGKAYASPRGLPPKCHATNSPHLFFVAISN